MEKNAAYEQLLESRKEKDRYNDRRTQTVNLTSRSRAVQASPPACEDASSQGTARVLCAVLPVVAVAVELHLERWNLTIDLLLVCSLHVGHLRHV